MKNAEKDSWWTWRWDQTDAVNIDLKYLQVIRWRRGWITIYKFVASHSIEWRVYFPFNLNVGISYDC